MDGRWTVVDNKRRVGADEKERIWLGDGFCGKVGKNVGTEKGSRSAWCCFPVSAFAERGRWRWRSRSSSFVRRRVSVEGVYSRGLPRQEREQSARPPCLQRLHPYRRPRRPTYFYFVDNIQYTTHNVDLLSRQQRPRPPLAERCSPSRHPQLGSLLPVCSLLSKPNRESAPAPPRPLHRPR